MISFHMKSMIRQWMSQGQNSWVAGICTSASGGAAERQRATNAHAYAGAHNACVRRKARLTGEICVND